MQQLAIQNGFRIKQTQYLAHVLGCAVIMRSNDDAGKLSAAERNPYTAADLHKLP
jgi:hypothetical protein